MVRSQPDLAKMAGILPNLTGSEGVLLESGNGDRIYRIPATIAFSSFVIFSCEPNTENYFRENYFF
jgi:hypothetical protein